MGVKLWVPTTAPTRNERHWALSVGVDRGALEAGAEHTLSNRRRETVERSADGGGVRLGRRQSEHVTRAEVSE